MSILIGFINMFP